MKSFEENERLELKKSTSELKEAMISIVAILNKHGSGELYFGIKNDGTPVGQDVSEKTLRSVSHAISDRIEPKIFPEISMVNIQNLTCVRVKFEGDEAPYFANGRAYLRVADEDRQLTSKELQKIIVKKYQSDSPWDQETPSKNEVSIDQVEEAVLKSFIERANLAGRIDFPFTNKQEILSKLNLIINNQLTNAADVLFGKGVVDLQMALFAGTERLTFIDIARENGNIFKLINEAEKYVKHFMKWSVKFGKMQREEIPEIPIEAIREAIVNSFAHRDYRNINNNEIAIFKDRIEIFNPGSFPEGFTPEDFIKGRQSSILRNKLIAQILYFSKDIENWGSGIRRIYELCKQNGVKVDFKITKAGFLVVFHRKVFEGENAVIREDEFSDSFTVIFSDMFTENFTENFSKAQKKILVAIFKSPKITQERLAEIVGISRRSIVSNMNKLKELGVIKRVGSDRQGRWEIKK